MKAFSKVLSVNGSSGSVTLNASDIDTTSYTPTHYTPDEANTQSHLAGIDDALGTKLNSSALSSEVTLYATTASGDFGYNRSVDSVTDSDYDEPAVDVPIPASGSLDENSSDDGANTELLGVFISDAGLFKGTVDRLEVPTIGEIRRSNDTNVDGGSKDYYARFYVKIFKRNAGGTETLLGTSGVTPPIQAVDRPTGGYQFQQFIEYTLITNVTFVNTDRIVTRLYADTSQSGTDKTAYVTQFGGDAPARTAWPVPVSVVLRDADQIEVENTPTNYTASSQNVEEHLVGIDSVLGGKLMASANLSDLGDAATARANLGLGSAATADSSAFATAAQGALADTAVQENDSPVFAGVTAGDGTAAAPAYSFSDDTNTGVYSPSDDNLAFATAGSNALTIDASQNVTAQNNLTVTGDLTVNGTTTTLDTQTLLVEDNLITVNNGETGAGVTAGIAGILVDRGTATDYEFVFDESDDSFKIGEVGSLQKVATREDTPNDNGAAFWDSATSKFETSTSLTLGSVNNNIGVKSADPRFDFSIGATTAETWSTSFNGHRFGAGGALWNDNGGTSILSQNVYHDGGSRKYLANGAVAEIQLSGGQVLFYTAASGTEDTAISLAETVRIDGSGNVKIGGGSAEEALDVDGNISVGYNSVSRSAVYKAFVTDHDSGNIGAAAGFGLSDGGGTSGVFVENVASNISGFNSQEVSILTAQGAVSVATERVRILQNGGIRFNSYGAGTLQTDASGNITASSDSALKTNTQPFTQGLSAVMGVEPKTYNWTEESGLDAENEYTGFIAQDVEGIAGAVFGEEGSKTLSDRALIATLWNAVRDLKAELDELKLNRGA